MFDFLFHVGDRRVGGEERAIVESSAPGEVPPAARRSSLVRVTGVNAPRRRRELFDALAVSGGMDTNTASPDLRARPGFWRKWPATTVCSLAAVTSLAVLAATSPPEPAPVPLALDVDEEEVEAPPAEEVEGELLDMKSEDSGARHKGEEGRMGKPTSKSKSGLYAMKGPADAHAFAAAPAGGDEADVWGGLVGTEIGEAYGVGGLGLVGTGRGGGGTGEGTIGLGSSGLIGKGGGGYGRGRVVEEPGGRYDGAIQSNVLTVGTVDDNADAKGYKEALAKLAGERRMLGISEDMYHLAAPGRRHVSRPRQLDVALVIDTTGSMGDELEYLKVEIRDIARKISREFPNVEQRWGLVVYRDEGDAYVTREFDFRGIEAFVDALGRQQADGGGDTPEAMEAAMEASSKLSWRQGDGAARMVFLVADAPTQNGADARRFGASVLEHRAARTAIYPVAGSGVDPAAEAELRLAAKVTGGQYIFLTDHSGVGGSHAKPKVDQFKVETLHAAMTNMIRGELGDESEKTGDKDQVARELDLPVPAPVATPFAVVDPPVVLVMVEPARPSFWEEYQQRLAEHFLFATGMTGLVLAAVGLDTLMRRRRRW